MLEDLFVGADSPIKGQVDTFADLPATAELGDLFVVKTTTGVIGVNRKVKGLYRWDGAAWVFADGIEANKVIYNNADSSLTSGTVKAAIDELDTKRQDASNLTSGTIAEERLPTITIDNDSVTNAKLANVATGTVKGRTSAGVGDVEDLNIATTLKAALNLNKSDVGLPMVPNVDCTNASRISSGTLADARLTSNVLLKTGGTMSGDLKLNGLLSISIGSWNSNTPPSTPGAQLTLSGQHNSGFNASRKLLIDGYDNESTVTIIQCVDENSNEDLVFKSGAGGVPTFELRGSITFSGDLKARRVGFRAGTYTMMKYSQFAYSSSGNYATVQGRVEISAESGWSSGSSLIMRLDNLGYDNKHVYIYGTLDVSGSVSKGSGSFDIPHPDPTKKDTHRLRHYFVETPSAGGNIYKYQINCTEGDNYIALPDYFEHLNTDSIVWANPFKHFGRAWGEVVEGGKRAKIVVEQSGTYNILIFGDRKDDVAMKDFNQYGIEYECKKTL